MKAGRTKEVLTYGETREILHEMDAWWEKLDKEGEEIEELIRKQPADEPLPADVRRKLTDLGQQFSRKGHFPLAHGICVFHHLSSKKKPRGK